jgi:hypothetical protein
VISSRVLTRIGATSFKPVSQRSGKLEADATASAGECVEASRGKTYKGSPALARGESLEKGLSESWSPSQ